MNAHADPQVFVVDANEQFMAQGSGDGLDLLDQGPRGRTEDDLLRPAIFHHRLALDQALGFQAIQQPSQGWPFYANALRQLTLGWRVFKTGQVQQHQPAGLGQAKPGQAAVQFGTPAARHMRQLHTKTVFIG